MEKESRKLEREIGKKITLKRLLAIMKFDGWVEKDHAKQLMNTG